jgi:peptidoglycan hydrolase FlgJ
MSIDPANSATGLTPRQERNQQLKKACQEFESVFTNEMLKSMRKTVDKCDLFSGGEGEEIYESLLDQELSKKMTGYGSNSLAELLYRQMSSIDSATRAGHEAESGAEISSGADRTVSHRTTDTAPLADRTASTEIAGALVDQLAYVKTEDASIIDDQTIDSELEDIALPAAQAVNPETQTGPDVSSAEDSLPGWPVKALISSRFGMRQDPFTSETKFHSGIDIAAEKGTAVSAAMSGKVIMSCNVKGYGNVVAVDHGEGLVTIYAHNEKNLVKVGDVVKKGSFIARVGSTGRSTGPHLHFEVRKDGTKINPLNFLGRA